MHVLPQIFALVFLRKVSVRSYEMANHAADKPSDSGTLKKWSPPHWEDVLQRIETMRKAQLAPADTMGSQTWADKNEEPKTYRFQVLIAMMLSAMTRDQVTFAAMRRLQQRGCANLAGISAISEEELTQLLMPVRFNKRKAHFIKQTSEILQKKYDGDVPDDVKQLCDLPGVGPKMAQMVLQLAFDRVVGIAVDVHVHRIANRLRWVRSATKDAEETRKQLESWLPREQWANISHLFAGLGQTVCQAVPRCAECACRSLCDYGSAAKLGNSDQKKVGEQSRLVSKAAGTLLPLKTAKRNSDKRKQSDEVKSETTGTENQAEATRRTHRRIAVEKD